MVPDAWRVVVVVPEGVIKWVFFGRDPSGKDGSPNGPALLGRAVHRDSLGFPFE